MSRPLNDHGALLAELSPSVRAALDAHGREAARRLSLTGVERYLRSAAALGGLQRGDGLVLCWLEQAPLVAGEIGEDVLGDLAASTLALTSRTSIAVVELLLTTAPAAAARLGDAELFRHYLQLIDVLVAQAPRGLRPLLDNLGRLLHQLSLGGLRRWALWGAHAHRSDLAEQLRYFRLESRESLAVLQQERKGTLLVDVQRRLNLYLRALWGRDFYLRPTAGDYESRLGQRPTITDDLLHLPDAVDTIGEVSGLDVYRAMAAHCAAHIIATRQPLLGEALNPLQRALVAVVEDARAETLAMRRFLGLRALWSRLHSATPSQGASAGDYLNRLARALLDPDYQDDDPWIIDGRTRFAQAAENLGDNRVAWEIGVTLAQVLDARRLPFNPHHDGQGAPYRDDNRYLWEFVGGDPDRTGVGGHVPQVRKTVNVMEMANEVDVETAGDDAQEIWVLASELFPYEDDGKSYNAREGKEALSPPVHYGEWDYQFQLERPLWTTVFEQRGKLGDRRTIDAVIDRYRGEIRGLKRILEALQPQGVQRVRKLEDGDETDLNAAIASLTDLRLGFPPDPRVMLRNLRRKRDLAILVLLDLSASTNDRVHGHPHTVLDLTREACALLADAVDQVGDALAIHGFHSSGRHDVAYLRCKDFDQPWAAPAKARLAGLTGQRSTRMGAAIRHAGGHLQHQPNARKLLLLITDGEPADVDVRDPQYLRHDARKAVEGVIRGGITPYCLSLDPRADRYVAQIFGQKNFLVLDHVERLPVRLPRLYAALAR